MSQIDAHRALCRARIAALWPARAMACNRARIRDCVLMLRAIRRSI